MTEVFYVTVSTATGRARSVWTRYPNAIANLRQYEIVLAVEALDSEKALVRAEIILWNGGNWDGGTQQ
jgi:hypothetical protein